ncbi:helix-turn-helix domain-containing protein [Dysosmobacter sp.]|uniref:helix-turn-helix domain-containing protein n=1 Tax=Dysosmobacter sp. TaxID=2591382 RepID=UPI003AB7C6B6
MTHQSLIHSAPTGTDTGADTIRMPRERIAQHISSARETVARILKRFSEDGLVKLKRGAITLRDKNQPKLLEIM